MLYFRREFITNESQNLRLMEPPAEEWERPLIDKAAQNWLDGCETFVLRPLGWNIAGTRKARNILDDEETGRKRWEGRKAALADVMCGKICRTNDSGLTYDATTGEPYEPRVRLIFVDGSSCEVTMPTPEEAGAVDPDAARDNDADGGKGKAGKKAAANKA